MKHDKSSKYKLKDEHKNKNIKINKNVITTNEKVVKDLLYLNSLVHLYHGRPSLSRRQKG